MDYIKRIKGWFKSEEGVCEGVSEGNFLEILLICDGWEVCNLKVHTHTHTIHTFNIWLSVNYEEVEGREKSFARASMQDI